MDVQSPPRVARTMTTVATQTPAKDPPTVVATAILKPDLWSNKGEGSGWHVLLVKRSTSNKSFPGCWHLPGGKVQPGEDEIDAARRETLEETAVRVTDLEKVHCTEAGVFGAVVLFVSTIGPKTEAKAVEKGTDITWVHLDKVFRMQPATPSLAEHTAMVCAWAEKAKDDSTSE